jgi:hypothetical protein
MTQRVKHGRQRFSHTYRWIGDVPLRDGPDAQLADDRDSQRRRRGDLSQQLHHRSARRARRHVELAACDRARWKIENESFNTLKTEGYNLEHNFGHGKKHLSAVLATLNLLAFAFHTVAESPTTFGCKPSTRLEPAPASSNVCDRSPSFSSSPLGRTCSQPWHLLTRRHSRHDKILKMRIADGSPLSCHSVRSYGINRPRIACAALKMPNRCLNIWPR